MSMHDDEPELAGYEPGDGTPLRSRRMMLTMRIVVVLGLVAFVLPGIITTLVVAANAAQESCRRWVGYEDSGSEANASASFELFGQGGPGWQCYATGGFGGEKYIAPLGLIPGAPVFPRQTNSLTQTG
jgi:hypothetical protein